MRSKSINKQNERAEQYGCDGNCYPLNGRMCPSVEICPATRKGEFMANVIAAVIILSIPLGLIIAFIAMIV